jgi:hypothetical protein
MSAHNHDEEIQKQFWKPKAAQVSVDKGPDHDLMILERIEDFTINDDSFIRHVLNKIEDDDKAAKMLLNFMNGKIGQAIFGYESKYGK